MAVASKLYLYPVSVIGPTATVFGSPTVLNNATLNGNNLQSGSTTYTFAGADSSSPIDAVEYSLNGQTYIVSTNPHLGVFSSVTLGSDPTGAHVAGDLSCFLTGTRIATEAGETAVEDLQIGDRLRLADGGTSAVVWIGHRSLDCSRQPQPELVLPIRIAAHAFGLGRPKQDLMVSPEHAIFVDGVLIPAHCLVNDSSIRQVEAEQITYWHVELDRHAVILAENLPVESYLDNGNRDEMEGGAALTLFPVFAGSYASPVAPIVTQGPVLQMVRDRLETKHVASAWLAGMRF